METSLYSLHWFFLEWILHQFIFFNFGIRNFESLSLNGVKYISSNGSLIRVCNSKCNCPIRSILSSLWWHSIQIQFSHGWLGFRYLKWNVHNFFIPLQGCISLFSYAIFQAWGGVFQAERGTTLSERVIQIQRHAQSRDRSRGLSNHLVGPTGVFI